MTKGLVQKCIGGLYTVICDNGEIISCRARGIFRKDGFSPTAGDIAILEDENGTWIIDRVLPRKNCLVRPFVANVDNLVLIFSATEPSFNTLLLDKMLTIAEYLKIHCCIVITKNDLFDGSLFARAYQEIGYPCINICATEPKEAAQVQSLLVKGINVFSGNSGVGKTTLLNTFAGLEKETAPISQKLGRGKHTTRESELHPISEGVYIGDTPGFSSLNLEAMRIEMEAGDLRHQFIEFERLSARCRFDDCKHQNEPGCAVLSELSAGNVYHWRYENYIELYKEIKAIKKY